jgi:hypothetical protein
MTILDISLFKPYNKRKGVEVFMYKKDNTLSDAERVRLDEITFYNFIEHLFQLSSNPTKVYSFIEAVCILAPCNMTIINSVVNICMTQDRRYVPTKEEHIHLLAKSDMSVRRIVSYLNISQRDYYRILAEQPPNIQPKFSPKQYIEIIKFLNCLTNLIPERIG